METYRTSPERFAADVLHIDLHDGQIEWLMCQAKTRVACCGRRWGKSYSTSVGLIHFGVMEPGTSQFLLAPTHDQTSIIFRYVERMLRDNLPEYVAKVVYSPFPELWLINDSVIRARSVGTDAANVRGHGADKIVIDEAAYVPAVVYEAITPMLANSPHGILELISTPFGRNLFFDYWQRGDGDEPGIRSFRYPSFTNPHLSRSYLEQQQRDMTGAAYAQEYLAEFNENQNSVFPLTLIESCRVSDIDPEPQPGHRYVIGYDPAKWSDRSGVVVLDATERPYRAVHVTDIGGRDYLVQANEIGTLAHRYNDAAVLLDATSHDQMLEQLRRDRVKAHGFKFTNESKGELINGLVMAMEQGQVRIPNHSDLIRELSYYRYEMTPAGNVRLGAPDKSGHYDDLVTALALAVQHIRSAPSLPFAWLRNDPDFREQALTSSRALTDAERIAQRRREQGLL